MNNVVELQRTEDWFEARLGKVTASRVADVVAKTKSGYSASRAYYMAQLIAEILTGNKGDSYSSAAVQWCTETEPKARDAYEFHTDYDVIETGFIDHPTIIMAGASPDGLIDTDGLVEIKCPNTATHIETLINKKIPKKYIYQMQWQMACIDRKWCDFVSYDPRMPDHLSIWIERLIRDDGMIQMLCEEINLFRAELDLKIEKLESID